jgi:hypothetical protein
MRLGGSGRTQINQTIMVGSDGEVPVIAIILLPFDPVCAYLTTADASTSGCDTRRAIAPGASFLS